ncbi:MULTISPECIES: hypothetical protein [Enterobacteriaceae]|uniref:hypothetical protein n=1 Tax=Enterobacteriaceae TaxID=543 RepID=UPI000E2BCB0A|nr:MULTISPECIES: hypothetical protein [Enterobacteriaceae]EEU9292225.1 hypothetical protein [Escherichia coli]EFI3490754.1 hypothetical protein [Escherichia coli]EFT1920527.1 hypothetical protein [Escherichia coli]EKK2853867.1 hypothetical protein [Escherichia coli]MBE1796685.1 hypothetical protein [Escherichia coli]
MPGIVVAQNFNNTALPAGESLASALIADSGVKNWFQADANSVTLSGNDIVSFNDRKGTASKLTRADAAKGATLVSNAFGQYSGARFNAAESDRSLFSGDVLDLTQPFSWSGVATLRALAASSNLCGTFTSSSVRAILNVSPTTNAGKLQFLYGSATCVGPTLDLNTPFAFVCGYDGTNIFLRVNGVMASVAAAGSPSSSAFALGALPGGSQFWDGDVSDLFLCTVAMNTSAGASLLTKLTAFYEDVYGLTL